MSELVQWARTILEGDLQNFDNIEYEINLGARKSDLGAAYADGTIAGIWYPRHAIPDEATLEADALRFAQLLAKIYKYQDLGRLPDSAPPEIAPASNLIDATAHPLRRRALAGQGYGLSWEERRVVELHAMTAARRELESCGLSVDDVSATESYDLRAKGEGMDLIVEVKGTTGGCQAILLTAQEVELHKRAFPNNALVIVYQIDLDRSSSPPLASGGKLKMLQPWQILEDSLAATAYTYALAK